MASVCKYMIAIFLRALIVLGFFCLIIFPDNVQTYRFSQLKKQHWPLGRKMFYTCIYKKKKTNQCDLHSFILSQLTRLSCGGLCVCVGSHKRDFSFCIVTPSHFSDWLDWFDLLMGTTDRPFSLRPALITRLKPRRHLEHPRLGTSR